MIFFFTADVKVIFEDLWGCFSNVPEVLDFVCLSVKVWLQSIVVIFVRCSCADIPEQTKMIVTNCYSLLATTFVKEKFA